MSVPNVASFADSLAIRARKRRHVVLAGYLATATRPVSILDVGGTVDYWHTVALDRCLIQRIVLLNAIDQAITLPIFEAIIGDARDLSRFADQEFDLTFSNSVIGHVGDFMDQQRMANEMRRVGKQYLLQTPNHGFPVDWRTLVPTFHWWPAKAQAWCFEHFGVGKYAKARSSAEARDWAVRIRNLRRSEIRELFPDSRLMTERVVGLTKSFLIHNLSDAQLPNRI